MFSLAIITPVSQIRKLRTKEGEQVPQLSTEIRIGSQVIVAPIPCYLPKQSGISTLVLNP